ncbi:MAG: LysE family translocator [Candidatus Eremiobacteraeota bacterium]|nr:LysE family translocator [Candidatus Eremiobacteraeota bacterium]MBV8204011.1 LysE family translocator [Candidatus Eremiobacteraeota bacterium]MBV8263778.1 LysE family translocator [Candidatus Eremiobacteraeota bacterium]MBV8338520.1 LysE family translocator [Candidatus Eremiobacteraeota bacterium]MBV8460514.1 LysE family translocator [Candidatus Eremiobacteraeota bacterium]
MITLGFVITSLVVVLVPGTGVLFTVSTALVHGRKASLFAALGCTAGILPHLFATVFGLAAIMHQSALAFQALKSAGVAYLLYVAYATWKDKGGLSVKAAPGRSAPSLAVKAVLLNVLNPKLTIFFLAFLPQFVRPAQTPTIIQLLTLSGVFMAMTLVIFILYGQLAHAFSKVVLGSRQVQDWLRRAFSAAFVGVGIDLALSER